MPDRVIRDELLDSERWLWLPNDTDRLAFVGLLLRCDDFGNLEGGPRRLFRFMHGYTQVKTEEAATTVLLHLVDADMVRRYEVEKREFYHLPRFHPHRQYLVRKCPPSPWDEQHELGKTKRIIERGLAKIQTPTKNIATMSHARSSDVAQGVGVGVGVGVGITSKSSSTVAPVDNFVGKSGGQSFAQHWTSEGKRLGINPNIGEQPGAYIARVREHVKKQKRK